MARAADAAGTLAVLGPQGMQTNEREIALSTVGSMSGIGGARYSLRPILGSAAIISGDTPNPRVQFQGGYGFYTFELTVTDASGNASTSTTTILYTGQ
jgi:hypothetical protein